MPASRSNFRQAADAIDATIRANHFHRAELDSAAYRQIEKDVIALGERATTAEEFMDGFNALWRKGPFSHVSLRKAQESAAERYARFDTEMAGPEAVNLTARQRRHPHREYHERCRHHRGYQRGLRRDRLALFDIPGGFHLRVPIADYYSIAGARLEGFGVTPDIAVSADQALDVALKD